MLKMLMIHGGNGVEEGIEMLLNIPSLSGSRHSSPWYLIA